MFRYNRIKMFEFIMDFFNNFTKEQKMVLAFCVLVIVCTLYRDCLICKWVPKLDGFKLHRAEHFEDLELGKEDAMVLFYAPWCGHCKSMMGDWEKLEKKAPNGLKIVKVNCDEKPEIASSQGVQGFPTIALFKGGKKIYFEGPRNLDNFLEFIKAN
jgi:protein disulfide-isomerase-like protein